MTVPIERRRDSGHRADPLWIAAMVHRVSGVALACFLPVHFLTLGLAIEGEARLNGFLRWTEQPAVKLGEAGLVFLLAIHFLGGLRVLVLENLGWSSRQKQLAAGAAALALLLALAFLVRAT
jgi:fumarate reductase subunit D